MAGLTQTRFLRPSEAVARRETDWHLPSHGWGRIDLAGSEPRAGRHRTDHGTARQARGLKPRAAGEIRSIPIPPALVALLRAHLKAYGTSPDGRLFRTPRGRPLPDRAYSAVWQAARTAVFTPTQQAGRGREWYRNAVDLGETGAMTLLGLLLAEAGRTRQALDRFQRAAQAGDSTSMTALGMLYRTDRPEEAERWFRQAAESGNANAMRQLGHLLHETGRAEEAETWLRRADQGGDTR